MDWHPPHTHTRLGNPESATAPQRLLPATFIDWHTVGVPVQGLITFIGVLEY